MCWTVRYIAATISRMVNPGAPNLSSQYQTQLLMSATPEEMANQIVSVLIQEFRMSQPDAMSLVPSGLTSLTPDDGSGSGVDRANGTGWQYRACWLCWSHRADRRPWPSWSQWLGTNRAARRSWGCGRYWTIWCAGRFGACWGHWTGRCHWTHRGGLDGPRTRWGAG